MFEGGNLLWLIPGFPLLGSLLCVLMGTGKLKHYSHLPAVFGSAMAFVVTVLVWVSLPPESSALDSSKFTWFSAGSLIVEFYLTLDSLSLIMLLVITFIGTWIVVFSIGYIHDEGYTRFFAVVSFFIFSMTLLVLAGNFLGLVAGWEGVGLCSYLLVGYWYYKPSAAAAARKAFLVTRLGDAAMLLGIFLLWSISSTTGADPNSLDIGTLNARAKHIDEKSHDLLNLAMVLLFCGAVGKSAQIPLYVWLPDAMEGPTPVSALIHAATMVTAGVYLLGRLAPLYTMVPEVQLLIAIIGAATALLAAFIALTQYDLKRVLAYSTVSQLGYMFLALGTGGMHVVPSVAVTAAIFHLFTHAFFKAVLFLSSGSVMHSMGDVIDMRRFSGLRKILPTTHLTFLAGAAALAGLPLLSGFWSKDQILEVVSEATQSQYGPIYGVLFYVALMTAFMTAFYTFRAYFMTFWGETKVPPEAGEHPHESPPVMTIPLIVLAIGALIIGAVVEPITHWFGDFLQDGELARLANQGQEIPAHHTNWGLILGSIVVAIGGVGLAYWMYGRKHDESERISTRTPIGYYLSLNRLYIDELYTALLVRPIEGIAYLCRGFESFIFDLVRTIAALPSMIANLIRPLQNGLVQFYGLSMAMGVAAFLFYLILWAGR